jgi:hypothetical protein
MALYWRSGMRRRSLAEAATLAREGWRRLGSLTAPLRGG